jgi:hypothetical protein
MDVALENPGLPGTEGARRRISLNLSGKRTEWVFMKLTSSYPFLHQSILHLVLFCPKIKRKRGN